MSFQRFIFYMTVLFSPIAVADVCVGTPTVTNPAEYAICAEPGILPDKSPSFSGIKNIAERFKSYLRFDSFSPGTAASNLRMFSKPGRVPLAGDAVKEVDWFLQSIVKNYHVALLDEVAAITAETGEVFEAGLLSAEVLASVSAIAVTAPEVAALVLAIGLGAEYMKSVTGRSVRALVDPAIHSKAWLRYRDPNDLPNFMNFMRGYINNLKLKNSFLRFAGDGSYRLSWAISTICYIKIIPHKMYVSFFTHSDSLADLERKSQSSNPNAHGLALLKTLFPEDGDDQTELTPRQFQTNNLYQRALYNVKPKVERNNYCDYLNHADKAPKFKPILDIQQQTTNTTNIIGIVRTISFLNNVTKLPSVEHLPDQLWKENDVYINAFLHPTLKVVKEQPNIVGMPDIPAMVTGFIYRGEAPGRVNYEYTVSPVLNQTRYGNPPLIAKYNILDISQRDNAPQRLIVSRGNGLYDGGPEAGGLLRKIEVPAADAQLHSVWVQNEELKLIDILLPENVNNLNHYDDLNFYTELAPFEIASRNPNFAGFQFNEIGHEVKDGIAIFPIPFMKADQPTPFADSLMPQRFFHPYNAYRRIAVGTMYWNVKYDNNRADTYNILGLLYRFFHGDKLRDQITTEIYHLLTAYLASEMQVYTQDIHYSDGAPWNRFKLGLTRSMIYKTYAPYSVITFSFYDAFMTLIDPDTRDVINGIRSRWTADTVDFNLLDGTNVLEFEYRDAKNFGICKTVKAGKWNEALDLRLDADREAILGNVTLTWPSGTGRDYMLTSDYPPREGVEKHTVHAVMLTDRPSLGGQIRSGVLLRNGSKVFGPYQQYTRLDMTNRLTYCRIVPIRFRPELILNRNILPPTSIRMSFMKQKD